MSFVNLIDEEREALIIKKFNEMETLFVDLWFLVHLGDESEKEDQKNINRKIILKDVAEFFRGVRGDT